MPLGKCSGRPTSTTCPSPPPRGTRISRPFWMFRSSVPESVNHSVPSGANAHQLGVSSGAAVRRVAPGADVAGVRVDAHDRRRLADVADVDHARRVVGAGRARSRRCSRSRRARRRPGRCGTPGPPRRRRRARRRARWRCPRDGRAAPRSRTGLREKPSGFLSWSAVRDGRVSLPARTPPARPGSARCPARDVRAGRARRRPASARRSPARAAAATPRPAAARTRRTACAA